MELTAITQPCATCPLGRREGFHAHDENELRVIQQWKDAEAQVPAGDTVVAQGETDPRLFTVLSGWGFRYSTLPDGRRQILNYIFPGDFLGLQSVLDKPRIHGIEALTAMRLCRFDGSRLHEIFGAQPKLAFDITWGAAQEERFLESHLVGVGRRSALERIAYMLAYIAARGLRSGLREPGDPIGPITQGHLADTLGMSLVHTNKTLRQLQAQGFVRWRGRRVFIDDRDGLNAMGRWDDALMEPRRYV